MIKETDNKQLIAQMDNIITELISDISSVSKSSPALTVEGKDLLKRIQEKYADTTKRIILGDEKASADLYTLVESVSEERVYLLSKAIDDASEKFRAKISTPFWLREQSVFLDQLDEIQRETTTIKSGQVDNLERASKLRQQIQNVADLSGRFERERRRAQYAVPLQVLTWEVPILIGIYISGKFDWVQDIFITGIFLAFAFLSYIIIRYWNIQRPRIAVRRNLFRITTTSTMLIYLMLLGIYAIGSILVVPYIFVSPMELELGSAPGLASPGSDIELPYSIRYASDQVAFDVKLSVDAPGLIMKGQPASYSALGKQTVSDKIAISIPQSTPDGVYQINVNCSFRIVSKWIWPFNLLQKDTYTVNKLKYITIKK